MENEIISEQPNTTKSKKPLLIALIGIVAVAIVVCVIVISKSTSLTGRYQRQLDLGNNYLEELYYEQAIACFEAAIKIDPMNEEAYENLVDAYLDWSDQMLDDDAIDDAIDLVNDAVESLEDMKTSDNEEIVDRYLQRLIDRLSELRQKKIAVFDDQLEQGEYDAALNGYLAILENDPMNVEAYLGIIEIYIRLGDYDKALEYAELGYEKTGDERLKEMIDMINGGTITDSRGYLLKRTCYDADGNIIYWHTFDYDSEGYMIGVTSFDPAGNQTSHVDTGKEPGTNIYHSYWWSNDGVLRRYDRETDELGRPIRDYHYRGANESDGIGQMYEYRYNGDDEHAYRVDRTDYSTDGSISSQSYEVYEYDSRGCQVRREGHSYYDGKDYISFVQMDSYDASGKWVRQDWYSYDSNGTLNYHHYKEAIYDDDGHRIGEREYDDDGSLLRETIEGR